MTPASSRPPPLGRPAQAGELALFQLADVEHALDLHQARLRPGRARERLAARSRRRAPPLSTVRPCAAARAAACRSRARPSPRRRSAGCTTRSRPAWSRFSLDGSSSRYQPAAEPWSVASHTSLGLPLPADGQPAGERPLGEPRPLRFVDTLGGLVRPRNTRGSSRSASVRSTCSMCILTANPFRARVRHPIFRHFRHFRRGAPGVTRGAPSWYGVRNVARAAPP